MKKPSPPRLPPLSLEVLNQVEQIERHFSTVMELCNDPARRQANEQRGNRFLRTYAQELLDAQFDYYEGLSGYRPAWDLEIAKSALEAMLSSFPLFMPSEPYRPELVRTINDYLEARFERPQADAEELKQASRKELRDAYFASFPEAKVLDVCWAAGQHYCEWKRWLRHAVKDDSAPDRAFVGVLTSGKQPLEYRKQRRPKGWK